jgi:hypothetical protein
MGRYFVVVVALLVVSGLGAGADDGVLLRYKFAPGESVTYEMDMDGDFAVTTTNRANNQQQAMNATMQMRMDMSMETLAVDDEGVGEVRVKYGGMDMDMQMGAQNIHAEFDLAEGVVRMGEQTQELPEATKKIMAEGMTMRMTPQGKVVEIKGGEALQQAMAAFGGGQQGFNLNLKEMLEKGQVQFPDGPVQVGDKWTQEQAIPIGQTVGDQLAKVDYEVLAFEHVDGRPCAKLGMGMALQTEGEGGAFPIQNPAGLSVTMKDMNLDGKGVLWFDYETGDTVKMEMQMQLSMKVLTKGEIKQNGQTHKVDIETSIDNMNMDIAMAMLD